MALIIKNPRDRRTMTGPSCVRLKTARLPGVDALPAGKVLVPLALWQASRDALTASRSAAEVGVWLAPDNEPADLTGDFDHIALIGIDFPVFRDGRGLQPRAPACER